MNTNRFSALKALADRSEFDFLMSEAPSKTISEYYGTNVFTDASMRKYLPEKAYLSVKAAIQSGSKLTTEVAEYVAEAMKSWAMEKGATHYAHWFQPLTGKTAEKHDSFFTLDKDGSAIEEFSVNELAQQEPDGSSFPGGGLRSTFEARGYTAWDPSSPAFIIEVGEGKTLCIPTIFVTYSGESLDYKLPLLKSQHFLENAALNICKRFDPAVNKVIATLGWEQEYFLVDEALYNARPDLMMCGRTILGRHAPKGQQLDDHYFGSIPERVYAFMRDLEIECHKLGIPVRTRHNEVGPGQYELAPMYEEVNVAVDHNQLLMDLMDRVARRHKLRVLLHEKPFAGVNGSGKHNNWSLSTDTGVNLLSPGKQPGKNLQFLTFFINTIVAVYEHADLLRASVASAGNDHRLGANEAPPAIVSVFIGEALTKLMNSIEAEETFGEAGVKEIVDLLSKIPNLEKDNTDRNRTSPFAFTGNKFEIRMVGSDMSCASPMTIMNTIVGDQLNKFDNELTNLINDGASLDQALLQLFKKSISYARPILFEGDGYGEEWVLEAAKRGLSNFGNTIDALKPYRSEKSKELFNRAGILTEKELDAHYEVKLENYILKQQIEARVLVELCKVNIIPTALNYQSEVADNILKIKQIDPSFSSPKAQLDLLHKLQANIDSIHNSIEKIIEQSMYAHKQTDFVDTAYIYCREVLPLMKDVRTYADELEFIIEDKHWPLVKYREMMFLR